MFSVDRQEMHAIGNRLRTQQPWTAGIEIVFFMEAWHGRVFKFSNISLAGQDNKLWSEDSRVFNKTSVGPIQDPTDAEWAQLAVRDAGEDQLWDEIQLRDPLFWQDERTWRDRQGELPFDWLNKDMKVAQGPDAFDWSTPLSSEDTREHRRAQYPPLNFKLSEPLVRRMQEDAREWEEPEDATQYAGAAPKSRPRSAAPPAWKRPRRR